MKAVKLTKQKQSKYNKVLETLVSASFLCVLDQTITTMSSHFHKILHVMLCTSNMRLMDTGIMYIVLVKWNYAVVIIKERDNAI